MLSRLALKQLTLADFTAATAADPPAEKFKNFKNTKFAPFSAAEQTKGLMALTNAPRAEPDRCWFQTDDEIDIRDLGLLSTRDAGFPCMAGIGMATEAAHVPLAKIIASQSSVKAGGLEAYLKNGKTNCPVLLAYKNHPRYQVLAGHTRIGAHHLAGRDTVYAIIVHEDYLFQGHTRRRPNWQE